MNAQAQSTLTIGGMACSGCADTVEEALGNLEGVKEAKVDLDNGSASVVYDVDAVSTDNFKQVIEAAGYEFKGL